MRCYIWGTNNRTDRAQRGRGVASFAIPDWGLQYRVAQDGTATVCEYAALLALLRFVEDNPKAFEGQRLEVLTDAGALIEHLNQRMPVGPEELKVWTLVRALKEKVPFELSWVAPEQNRAITGVLDMAPLKMNIQIQTGSRPRKSPPFSPKS